MPRARPRVDRRARRASTPGRDRQRPLRAQQRARRPPKPANAHGQHACGGSGEHVDRGHEQRAHRGDGRHRRHAPRARAGPGPRGPVGSPRARAPSGSNPTADHAAPERQRGRRGAITAHHGREHEVGGVEAEQGAEQQAIHRRARLEDVAGQDHACGERGHEQQRGGLAVVAVAPRAVGHAPAYPSATAIAGDHRAHTGGVGGHEAGEGGRARGVREEGEPAQHDPGAEHAARHGQQHQLEQRLAQKGRSARSRRRRHRPSLTRMILNKARYGTRPTPVLGVGGSVFLSISQGKSTHPNRNGRQRGLVSFSAAVFERPALRQLRFASTRYPAPAPHRG